MIKPLAIADLYRKLCICFVFPTVILILYACPYSSPYKLDQDASIPVDDALLGKWATMVYNKKGSRQPVKMILSKKSDTEYYIDFTGDLNDLVPYKIVKNDSIKGSAYMSTAANKQFLNIEIKGQTYISLLIYRNDTLSLMPLADGFTAKYIKSDAQLRTAVEVHVRTWEFPRFDEEFSLKDMVRVN
ncbi:MAG: hypothetical protein ABI741_00960 [Ferruginibacter sp.]